jgi:hypothetical protein
MSQFHSFNQTVLEAGSTILFNPSDGAHSKLKNSASMPSTRLLIPQWVAVLRVVEQCGPQFLIPGCAAGSGQIVHGSRYRTPEVALVQDEKVMRRVVVSCNNKIRPVMYRFARQLREAVGTRSHGL